MFNFTRNRTVMKSTVDKLSYSDIKARLEELRLVQAKQEFQYRRGSTTYNIDEIPARRCNTRLLVITTETGQRVAIKRRRK